MDKDLKPGTQGPGFGLEWDDVMREGLYPGGLRGDRRPMQNAFARRYDYNPYDDRWRWGGYGGYRPWRDEYSARAYGARIGVHGVRGHLNHLTKDAKIANDVTERLMISPKVDARNILVEVENGVVTLKGSVAEIPEKLWAEEIADSVYGVTDINNLISVQVST